MPLSDTVGWTVLLGVVAFYGWLVGQAKTVETESRVEAQCTMSDPDILIGDFGQVTIVYDNYFKHEWIVNDPFDCLKELGLIGNLESPKLDEPSSGMDAGEPE